MARRAAIALFVPLSISSASAIDCQHGGEWTGLECVGCRGAWRGSQHVDSPFYVRAADGVAIDAYVCNATSGNARDHRYLPEGEPAPFGCELERSEVFFGVSEGTTEAIPVFELVDEAMGENHIYSLSEDLEGFMDSRVVFYAFADEQADNATVPVFLSLFESAETQQLGRVVDYTLSTDPFEHKACALYDRTVPMDELRLQIDEVVNASMRRIEDDWPTDALTDPTSLLGVAIGGGLNSVTGAISNFPVATLSYAEEAPPPSQYFGLLRAPDQVSLEVTAAPALRDVVSSFTGPEAYVAHVKSATAGNEGVTGTFETPWQSVLESTFNPNKGEDRTNTLSVVQAQYEVFRAALSANLADITLDRYFVRALEGLPPTLETEQDRELFFQVFEVFGTSVIVEVAYGGLAELKLTLDAAAHANYGGEFSAAETERLTQILYTSGTGEGGHTGDVPAEFLSGATQQWACYGGDPVLAASCGNGDNTDLRAWLSSTASSPRPLTAQVLPISQFVVDPLIRVAVIEAAAQYSAQIFEDWDALEKCPKCGGYGYSCGSTTGTGSDTCMGCASPCRVGRRCDDSPFPVPCIYPAEEQWEMGFKGAFTPCPADTMVRGICNSGKSSTCGLASSSWMQNCIPPRGFGGYAYGSTKAAALAQNATSRNAHWLCGQHGWQIECPAGQVVVGRCASNRDKECPGIAECGGGKTSHAILCAPPPAPYVITGETVAAWGGVFGKGQFVNCPENQWVCGVCSGGENPDCRDEAGNRGYGRIKCCGKLVAQV